MSYLIDYGDNVYITTVNHPILGEAVGGGATKKIAGDCDDSIMLLGVLKGVNSFNLSLKFIIKEGFKIIFLLNGVSYEFTADTPEQNIQVVIPESMAQIDYYLDVRQIDLTTERNGYTIGETIGIRNGTTSSYCYYGPSGRKTRRFYGYEFEVDNIDVEMRTKEMHGKKWILWNEYRETIDQKGCLIYHDL